MLITILIILLVTTLTALVSISGGVLLLTGSKLAKTLQRFGPIIAALVLIYAAFFDVIPEALEAETLPVWGVALLIFAGFAICQIFGLVMGHFHKHDDAHELKDKRQATTMVIVDSIHAVADGVVIGASFAATLGTGLLTAVSTAAHEIPQEIGDFAIMIRSKMKKDRILKIQVLTSLIIVPVSLVAFFISDLLTPYLPILLSLIAGFLIYIAIGEISIVINGLRRKAPKLIKKIK